MSRHPELFKEIRRRQAGDYAESSQGQFRTGVRGGDGFDKEFDWGVYEPDEREFLQAMQEYQRRENRKFPKFTEVLAVLKSLGYRKVEPAGPLPKCVSRL